MAIGRHVLIGGGLAGAKTAEALRTEGFDGEIVLIGAEPELPYERPPLSKDYLRGESPRDDARVHPESFYREQRVDLRLGTTVESIDPGAHEVELRGGERLAFDRLLLATGAEPRRLKIRGSDLDGVHYLRDLRDADELATRLDTGGRLAVIGGGWIGAEVAASARQKGLEVAMIERSARPLEHVLGAEAAGFYAELHRDHGVALHTEVDVDRFAGAGRVEAVELADGRRIDCDLVVIGVGVLPRTALAEQAGVGVENGVVVSDRLESSIAGIFAAGDVANADHPFYGHRLRVEHWANALHQPEVVARAMLDKPASYDRLPYFFSDQYDVGMEYAGYAVDWDRVVFRGDPRGREFIAFWLKAGRVVAGMNVNVWDVTDAIQALIRSRQEVPEADLRDPDKPLDALAAAR
ncbi:MAG TPA: FAD/NAD(P)-binding oxidoreductase [Solirubrobacterales bacterium]|nr:FAD/NAD(P)-binding oxidoreductase [Solirubrobacterales bacterium]